MGLDMYLRVRKKDLKDKIPNELLSKDGYYINENLSDEEFVKRLGYEKAMGLIMNKYLFVWHKPTTNYVGIDVTEEIGYWRKANAIHNWFVENVQNGEDDCETYVVSKDKIKELKKICERVYDSLDDNDMKKVVNEDGFEEEVYNNTEIAEELLPTVDGFFFGGTGYTKWYKDSLLDTIHICNDCEFVADDMEFLYHSSW